MTLTYNYDIEYNGTIITSGDPASPYALIQGSIFGDEGMRSSDNPRGQQDGEFAGLDLLAGRDITLQIEIWATNETELQAAYLQLMTAVAKKPNELPLRFRLPGFPDLRLMARPRKKSGPVIDVPFSEGTMATMTVQFHATDPRFYSDALNSVVTGNIATSGGFTFNMVFDLSFGGASTSNSINAVNIGNYETPWTAVIAGPVTNPKIEHLESGKILQFVGTVVAGDTLTVSSPPYGSVILNGTGSRYNWLQDSSQWFLLQPGTNTVRFSGSSAGVPTMTLNWRSAWML